MMKKTLLAGLSCLTALATSAGFAANTTPGNDYTRTVARPYPQVLAAVKQAAQAHGFRVSNVHDISASLRKEGINREPYATVEVCNSRIAAQLLDAEPLLGSVMPCRIAVFQQGTNTTVSMLRPTELIHLFPARPGVDSTAARVEAEMEQMINEATR